MISDRSAIPVRTENLISAAREDFITGNVRFVSDSSQQRGYFDVTRNNLIHKGQGASHRLKGYEGLTNRLGTVPLSGGKRLTSCIRGMSSAAITQLEDMSSRIKV